MITASEALARLREGNQRFVQGVRGDDAPPSPARRAQLAAGQSPWAIVFSCADSRVPPELVFDQGLGELFVIRVAGNVLAPSLVGSVEYAAEVLGSPLVVVLGHTGCGAVAATLEELQNPTARMSRNLRAIIEAIRPGVEELLLTNLRSEPTALAREAMRANVRATVAGLSDNSDVLQKRVSEEGLKIVGAEYVLDSGEVNFIEGVRDADA